MVPSRTLAAHGSPKPARVAGARATSALLPSPFSLFQLPAIQTFAADCTTPKTTWTLGEDICVTASVPAGAPGVPHRVQLVNPAGFVIDSLDMVEDPQTVTFTLPSVTDFSVGNRTYDNRGTWRINLTDVIDANVTALGFITVRDPVQTVTNLQINKLIVNSATATAGANVQSVVRVFNAGPDAAANVKFTDVPPANTTFQSLVQNGGPTFNCTTPAPNTAGTSECTAATFANGATADFTVTYKVNGNVADAAELTTSASVESTTTETEAIDNGATETLNSDNPTPPACTMACPDNITVTAAPGQSGATVAFADPTLSGTCGGVTNTPASGTFFPIGTTPVTSTANGGSCSFFVTVNPAVDTAAPSISCPADITVSESAPAANSATVTYSVTASDDSGTATVVCDPPSGSSFPAGTTEVQCIATDASNNSSSCSFNVTVTQVGCDLDANSAPPVPNVATLPTITRACSVTLLPTDDPTAADACGTTLSGETSNDRTYDVPGTYTVVWTYTDSAGHTATQNQTIVILPDTSAPVPDAASLPTVTGECFAAITGDAPTATDNCGGSGLEGTPLDPLSYSTVGTHTVRWKFTDAAGNSTIQNQTVVVTDTHAPTVALTGPSSVTVECHTSYTDAGATATDNCSPAPTPSITSNNVNLDVPGTYQIVWSATDAGGNTASATRTVVVVDTTKPVITLNGSSLITILLHAAFTDPGATAADSCAGSVSVTVSGTVNNHAVGTYVLTYTATDPSGNAADPVTRTVKVIYDFSGFFSPINNLPTINQMNAGRSIPVKFSLAGNQGLGIMAAGSPYSQQINCSTSAPIADIEATETPGGSTLTYDAGSAQYHYNWKTEKSWAGTCRVLTVALIDGTTHTAAFKFK
ncbi:MAG: PxKF domain-containing protein [Pyrinomonadaceae bacterium]